MRWLITGGCGFIGRALAQHLAAACAQVVVLDNLSGCVPPDLETSVRLYEGDVCDSALVRDLAAEADAVVHLAAMAGVGPSVADPRSCTEVNVLGTLNVLEAARERPVPVVLASSGAVGQGTVSSPYGASKAALEAYGQAYVASYRLPVRILRFSNVYGPGSGHKSSVIANFIRKAILGEELPIYGDGLQTRDFVYVLDVARAILHAAQHVDEVGPFRVSSDEPLTIQELSKLLQDNFQHRLPPLHFRYADPLPGEVRHPTTASVPRVPGWEPSTHILHGLNETITYFRRLLDA